MICDLRKVIEGDKQEIINGLDICRWFNKNARVYNYVDDPIKALLNYAASAYYECKIGQLLNLTLEPNWWNINSDYKHSQATTDYEDGYELKCTWQDYNTTLERWLNKDYERLHGAKYLIIYNFNTEELTITELSTKKAFIIEHKPIKLGQYYYTLWDWIKTVDSIR